MADNLGHSIIDLSVMNSIANEPPVVSVVTATYNRANVLRYSIESVLAQTLTDWEMWIVGDACTDDTEAVVRGFGDSRLHFVNLPRQTGDQAEPNNEGVRLSRGRYIAFLNHDDLWFPDHLSVAVDALHESGADLVWPLIVKRQTDGWYTCDPLNDGPHYAPHVVVPASLWVLRREIAAEIGPWRHHSECHSAPSQEWLFRAHRGGKDLRYHSRFTAVLLPSGGRPGGYAKREFEENAAVYRRLASNPALFRETVLLRVAEYYSVRQSSPPVWGSVVDTFRDVVRRALASYWHWPRGAYTSPLATALRSRARRWAGAAGLHPMTVEMFGKYRRKGGFIRHLRQFRGLSPEPSRDKQ
jgi:glycosyltransferase involved in cell wall biosynthesis